MPNTQIVYIKTFPAYLMTVVLAVVLNSETYAIEFDSLNQKEESKTGLNFNGKSDIEMLVELSQTTEKDKIKYERLKNDSIRIEPIFQKATDEYLQINAQLDTISVENISEERLAILHHKENQLKDLLDYLLVRRRSLHQQLRILKRKLDKEKEIINYVMKGDLAQTLEITEQDSLDADLQNYLKDSDSISNNFADDPSLEDLNQYNWKVSESVRELRQLSAKLKHAQNLWKYAEDLINLNLDELTVAISLLENSNNQIHQFTDTLITLNRKLNSLQELDSADQLQSAIELRIIDTKNYVEKLKELRKQDSTLVNDLEARGKRLEEVIDPLKKNINNIGDEIQKELRHLEYLKGPFAPHNIYAFLTKKAPRILIIIVILIVVWIIAKISTKAILMKVIMIKSKEARQERVETLNKALLSGLATLILFLGIIGILTEMGLNISVLLGGAAVFSLAIAFGTQNLVKDYFSGFMILAENQYRVGNVVKINGISGVVEDISLRLTILRDLEGIAHFIPHGEITIVSNLTHHWSQVDMNIGVAYKENVDQVMEVVMDIANNMKEDPAFEKLILKPPELLGVDSLADSAVVIKLTIRTLPMKQWMVKREFLRRIKNRFDELGIEIPFPHRMVYHKSLEGKSE